MTKGPFRNNALNTLNPQPWGIRVCRPLDAATITKLATFRGRLLQSAGPNYWEYIPTTAVHVSEPTDILHIFGHQDIIPTRKKALDGHEIYKAIVQALLYPNNPNGHASDELVITPEKTELWISEVGSLTLFGIGVKSENTELEETENTIQGAINALVPEEPYGVAIGFAPHIALGVMKGLQRAPSIANAWKLLQSQRLTPPTIHAGPLEVQYSGPEHCSSST